MKNLKLIAILFLILIACEKEEILQVSVNIEVQTTIDTIYTGDSEFPMISSESNQISELCKVRIFYQNLNLDPSYNEGIDHYIGRDTICNGEKGNSGVDGIDGENGEDGEDAESPEFHFVKIPLNDLCNILCIYEDDVLKFQDTLCDGATGWIVEYDTIVKAYFIYDTIREITSQIDTIIRIEHDSLIIFDTISRLDTLIILKIDTVVQTIVRIDSVFIIDKDTTHFLKEKIIIPGPIKFWPKDTIWSENLFSPGFSISNMEFIGGNKKGATLQVFGKDNFGNIFLLFDFYWDPVPDFDWTIPDKYKNNFNNPIDTVLHFSSVGVLVKYDKPLCGRNDYVHLMNIRITAIKEE